MRLVIGVMVALAGVPAWAGEDVARIALLVLEEGAAVAESLGGALSAEDPAVRATGARVAGAGDDSQLLTELRSALDTETDAVAAREQVRALLLLGGAAELDPVLRARERFAPLLDPAIGDAVGRLGGSEAIRIYAEHLASSEAVARSSFLKRALWGRPHLASMTGARLLAVGDVDGFVTLLGVYPDELVPLDAGLLVAAIRSRHPDAREAALWYLAENGDGGLVRDQRVVEALADLPEKMSDREAFARELVRRVQGAPRESWADWSHLTNEGSDGPFHRDELDGVRAWLTENEAGERVSASDERNGAPVPEPPWVLPGLLPPGVADAVLDETGCSHPWLGVGGAATDLKGRVIDVDLDGLRLTSGCRRALETLMRLSYVENETILSPHATPHLLLVKPRGASLCLDEPAPGTTGVPERGVQRVASRGIEAPVAVKKTQPVFPESVRRRMKRGVTELVELEAWISPSGCVRGVRLVRQSPYAELNVSALLAVSEWQFEPGTYEGKPVEVRFRLTISFKLGR